MLVHIYLTLSENWFEIQVLKQADEIADILCASVKISFNYLPVQCYRIFSVLVFENNVDNSK